MYTNVVKYHKIFKIHFCKCKEEKNMIKRLKKVMLRKELRKRGFYEGVILESDEIEKVIAEWIFDLKKFKQIEINRFTELFCNWKEIILPVKIQKKAITNMQMRFIITDAEEKSYYMIMNRLQYLDLQEYYIGRRGNVVERNVDREYHYIIHPKNQILLDSSYAGLINEDGTNQNCMVAIHYNIKHSTATASIKNEEKKIVISYNAKDSSSDNDVINYLLSIKDKDDYKDVLQVLKDFVAILGNSKDITLIESREKDMIYSRVCIKEGIVTEYSYFEEGEHGEKIRKTIYSPQNIII